MTGFSPPASLEAPQLNAFRFNPSSIIQTYKAEQVTIRKKLSPAGKLHRAKSETVGFHLPPPHGK